MTKEKVVNTFCAPHCMNYPCEFQVTVRDGQAVRQEVHPKMKFAPCLKGWTGIRRLYHPDRLKYPLKRVGQRGQGKWQRISWDEALDIIVQELNAAKTKYGNESIVMYHYVAWHGYPGVGTAPAPRSTILRLLNLWGGCIPAYHRGSLCWQALIQALTHLFGTIHVAFPPDKECELIVIWGTNPAETGVRGMMQSLLEAKEKGTKFVVIDPVFTPTAAALADDYLPICPGTDTALALTILNLIIEEGLYDREMLLNHTNAPFLVSSDSGELLREEHLAASDSERYMVWDMTTNKPQAYDSPSVAPALNGTYEVKGIELKPVWQRLTEHVSEWTPQKAARITEVPEESIRRLAREFGAARPAKVITSWSPGMQKAAWGESAVSAVHSLNVITGNLLGHLPRLGRLSMDIGFEGTLKRLEVENPVQKRIPVNHLAEAILHPSTYGTNIRALLVMSGNPVSQNADSNKTIEALKKLDFIAVSDIFMSATAKYADIVLPACTGFEKSRIFEGSEVSPVLYDWCYQDHPRKQLFFSEEAVEPLGESRDDFEVVCELARRMGYKEHFPWMNAEEWIEHVLNMAKEDPRFPWLKQVTMEKLKREGIVDVDMPPPQPSWAFPTPSGRVELYSEVLLKKGYDPMPVYREPSEGKESTPELYQKYPLNMVSPHTILRAQSSFSNQPEILEIYPPDILIHPLDASARGIKDGDRVVVFNERGRVEITATVSQRIKPGVVRLLQGGWPEHGMANLLTSDRLTPLGENPTYNTCLVEVKRAPDIPSIPLSGS